MFAIGAVTCLILSAVQFIAHATGRVERWSLWWGLSNLLIGLGVIVMSLRGFAPDLVTIPLANVVLLAGTLILVMGLRRFAGREQQLPFYAAALAVTAVLLTIWIAPADFTKRVALVSLMLAACDVAVAREGLHLMRKEGLLSGGILAGLFATTALLFLVRGGNAMIAGSGTELFPPNGSAEQWVGVTGIAFILLRSNVLLLLAMERSQNALLFLARHDPLTEVLNRNGLEMAVADLTKASSNQSSRLALVLIDIDHFKAVNDTHGHAAGDRILRIFAQAAQAQLPAAAVLARQGGDEFAAVLPGLAIPEAVQIADRIRAAFARDITEAAGITVRPTLSIGIAEGAGTDTLDSLLRRADQALYRSKRMGRDRVQVQVNAMAA